jgi:hypothetical protein
MVSWELDYDIGTWIAVPPMSDPTERAGWTDNVVGAVAADFATMGGLAPDYPQALAAQFELLIDLATERTDLGNMLVHLPGPGFVPCPVFVAFREPQQESPDYLLEVAGARGAPAIETPIVEQVATDDLGEGIRVLRYADDGAGGVVANLCYAWRAHDTDVIVFTQLPDLARLEEMLPDLQSLTAAIRPTLDAGSAP